MKSLWGWIFFVAALLPQTAHSQFSVTYFSGSRSDWGLGYNYFVGTDSKDFQTTVMGFGSGFLLDAFSGRFSHDMITLGNDQFNVSLGLGYAISKYRFSKNLVFENTLIGVTAIEDPDPSHDYVNSFFGYGKSKLVYASVYIPVNLTLITNDLEFTAGVLADFFVGGKLKRKFIVDGDKKVEKIGNSDFKDFDLNKEKLGFNAMVYHKKSRFGLAITYLITPFFKSSASPELNEVRISLSYRLKNGSERLRTKNV